MKKLLLKTVISLCTVCWLNTTAQNQNPKTIRITEPKISPVILVLLIGISNDSLSWYKHLSDNLRDIKTLYFSILSKY